MFNCQFALLIRLRGKAVFSRSRGFDLYCFYAMSADTFLIFLFVLIVPFELLLKKKFLTRL